MKTDDEIKDIAEKTLLDNCLMTEIYYHDGFRDMDDTVIDFAFSKEGSFSRELAQIQASRTAKYYETVIMPAERAKARAELIAEIEKSWSATNYHSPEAGKGTVNSIDTWDWQQIKQKYGVEQRMGLFNDIENFAEKCPGCGDILQFQTKDDFNDELYLNQVDFRSVREFSTFCSKCRIGISYTFKEDWRKRTIKDYERKVKQ